MIIGKSNSFLAAKRQVVQEIVRLKVRENEFLKLLNTTEGKYIRAFDRHLRRKSNGILNNPLEICFLSWLLTCTLLYDAYHYKTYVAMYTSGK